MNAAVFGVLYFLPSDGAGGSFVPFLLMFMLLFTTTGIGNGSTFRMISIIFRTERARAVEGQGEEAMAQAMQDARKESAAVLGFSSAMAAYGAFFIPKAYGTSITMTRRPGRRAVRLHRVLRDLHRGDVVVVFPQGRRDALLTMCSGGGLGELY
jgi:NNP family nitrate/nitrite transporter-like MFS transporter